MNIIKSLVSKFFGIFGIEVRQKTSSPDLAINDEYGPVTPYATYRPWNTDRSFLRTYNAIKEYTLVDEYRCFELWQLLKQCSKLDSGNIIEIGVWRGGTGALIAKQAEICAIRGEVYLCDTYKGVVKASSKDPHYDGGEHNDTSLVLVEKLMSELELKNVRLLEGIFPNDTASEVTANEFRFCHIDVDVYQSAKDIVEWIWDKMVPGGIIVYDDYGFASCQGITQYVEEQFMLKDRLVFHNLNGHAVVIKL